MSLFACGSIHQGLEPERFSDKSRGRREITFLCPRASETHLASACSLRREFIISPRAKRARSTWTARGLTELQNQMPHISFLLLMNAVISRKTVEKSARDNSKRYGGWVWVHCLWKKFECLRVLRENNKSRFHSCSVSNSAGWTYPILPFVIVACARNCCIQGGELLPIHSPTWISKFAKRSSRVLPADFCTDHAH